MNHFSLSIDLQKTYPVDLRECHDALQRKGDFSGWARRKLAKFTPGTHFEVTYQSHREHTIGRPRIDYGITLSCAKTIAQMDKTPLGSLLAQHFGEVESAHFTQLAKQDPDNHSAANMPTSLPEALRLAADLLEERDRLATEKSELLTKAAFHDKILQIDDELSVAEAAQIIGFGQNRFFATLRDRRILIGSGTRRNLPFQVYLERGYFKVRESAYEVDGETRLSRTTKVTQKGLAWLTREFGKEAA